MDTPLSGLKILIAHDDYFVAGELAAVARRAGGEIVGSTATLAAAWALVRTPGALNAALVRTRLQEMSAEPLIDELEQRRIPTLLLASDSPQRGDWDSLANPRVFIPPIRSDQLYLLTCVPSANSGSGEFCSG